MRTMGFFGGSNSQGPVVFGQQTQIMKIDGKEYAVGTIRGRGVSATADYWLHRSGRLVNGTQHASKNARAGGTSWAIWYRISGLEGQRPGTDLGEGPLISGRHKSRRVRIEGREYAVGAVKGRGAKARAPYCLIGSGGRLVGGLQEANSGATPGTAAWNVWRYIGG